MIQITRRPLPHLPADPGLIPLMENGHVSAINGNHKVDADDDDIIVLEDTGAAKRSARRRSTCVPADSVCFWAVRLPLDNYATMYYF
jgi:hypothetical protein